MWCQGVLLVAGYKVRVKLWYTRRRLDVADIAFRWSSISVLGYESFWWTPLVDYTGSDAAIGVIFERAEVKY